jgi:hypothetical protein
MLKTHAIFCQFLSSSGMMLLKPSKQFQVLVMIVDTCPNCILYSNGKGYFNTILIATMATLPN